MYAPYIYMKTRFWNNSVYKLAVIALALQLTCCGDRFPSRFALVFPRAPEPWVSLLGEPHWRVEWLDPGGRRQIADIVPGGSLEIELPTEWANPVTARPYWPGINLFAGLFMPAGALFPFDVDGSRLCLSWEAGPDTVFYWELAQAGSPGNGKNPANFDWPRFRELFKSEDLNADVSRDPWLVDWRFAAEKTIEANFDRRRLVPQSTVSMNIPVSSGPWYGTSPFADPLTFAEREQPSFPVRPGLNVWISREGILRVNGNTQVFTKW